MGTILACSSACKRSPVTLRKEQGIVSRWQVSAWSWTALMCITLKYKYKSTCICPNLLQSDHFTLEKVLHYYKSTDSTNAPLFVVSACLYQHVSLCIAYVAVESWFKWWWFRYGTQWASRTFYYGTFVSSVHLCLCMRRKREPHRLQTVRCARAIPRRDAALLPTHSQRPLRPEFRMMWVAYYQGWENPADSWFPTFFTVNSITLSESWNSQLSIELNFLKINWEICILELFLWTYVRGRP